MKVQNVISSLTCFLKLKHPHSTTMYHQPKNCSHHPTYPKKISNIIQNNSISEIINFWVPFSSDPMIAVSCECEGNEGVDAPMNTSCSQPTSILASKYLASIITLRSLKSPPSSLATNLRWEWESTKRSPLRYHIYELKNRSRVFHETARIFIIYIHG